MVRKDIYVEKHKGKGIEACFKSPVNEVNVCQSAEATERSKKHKVGGMSACRTSRACRPTKCDVNEVNAHCKRTFREGADNRIKHSEEKKMRVIQLYLENMGIRKQGLGEGSLLHFTSE